MMRNQISGFPVLWHELGTLGVGDYYFKAGDQADADGVQIFCVGPNREELPVYPNTGGLPHDFKAEPGLRTTAVVLVKRAGHLQRAKK